MAHGLRSSGSGSGDNTSAPNSSTAFSPGYGGRQHDRSRPAHRSPSLLLAPSPLLLMLTCLILLFVCPASAVLIPFDNCLGDKFQHPATEQARPLQWVPLFVDAAFDTAVGGNHKLVVTVWGNVTGRYSDSVDLPPPESPAWHQDNMTAGKIEDLPFDQGQLTTLIAKVKVLQYEKFNHASSFCGSIVNGTCPLAPVFSKSQITRFEGLPSFKLDTNLYNPWALASLTSEFSVKYVNQREIGCIQATVTPSIGDISWLLKFLPLIVLMFVGFATVFAAIVSPWGSTDLFHWSTNYGRDPDLLRLVTPGFGDCLQYIQFVVLTAGLGLNYPGFYRPIVSQAAWSTLMFNHSFVTHDPGYTNVQDGIYVTTGNYGLHKLGQLVGLRNAEDIWPGMMVWLLIIIGTAFIITECGFLVQYIRHFVARTAEEDLRRKNIPFSVGNVIRIVFNFFLLPLVSFATFQLVIHRTSLRFVIALAAVTLVLILGFAAWLLYFIATSKPRSILFDDLRNVLVYGPLYNTFSDGAASFALLTLVLVFIRGMAIGAIQSSGITQIILLAICEVIQVITLHAFRPFNSPTSMNAFHTLFAAVRLVTIFLMVSFVPALHVSDSTRGWIGYAILAMHCFILFVGFFLNALQTVIEVVARLLGAGGDDQHGQTRGGLSKIFGMRQLRRRPPARREDQLRASAMSMVSMRTTDKSSQQGYVAPTPRGSLGSMGQMLIMPHRRNSSGIDTNSVEVQSRQTSAALLTPLTPMPGSGVTSFNFLQDADGDQPSQVPPAVVSQEPYDPWYRPPRKRYTFDSHPNTDRKQQLALGDNVSLGPSGAPRADGGESDPNLQNSALNLPSAATPLSYTGPAIEPAPNTDYSTREMDFYYRGVRGPALKSEGVGRKLGTGPADPTSTMTSAAGWLRNIMGFRGKDKFKGFEVVRSSRMPPSMRAGGGQYDEGGPEGIPVVMETIRRRGPIESDEDDDDVDNNNNNNNINIINNNVNNNSNVRTDNSRYCRNVDVEAGRYDRGSSSGGGGGSSSVSYLSYDDVGPPRGPPARVRSYSQISTSDADDAFGHQCGQNDRHPSRALVSPTSPSRQRSIPGSTMPNASASTNKTSAAAVSLRGIEGSRGGRRESTSRRREYQTNSGHTSRQGSGRSNVLPWIPRKSSKRRSDSGILPLFSLPSANTHRSYNSNTNPGNNANLEPLTQQELSAFSHPYRDNDYDNDDGRSSSAAAPDEPVVQPTRLPFHRSRSQGRLSSGSSGDLTEQFSDADSPTVEDRPASVGCVSHHSIQRVDPDREHLPRRLGASAEFMSHPSQKKHYSNKSWHGGR